MTNLRQALAFVRKHGVVLESARGPVPSLAEAIAGGPIRGSWWSHPRSHLIFELTQAVRDDASVLVCRAVDGKVTFIHARLWPALIRLGGRLPRGSLARIAEVHTTSGRHVVRAQPFPSWAPPAVRTRAARLTDDAARRALVIFFRDESDGARTRDRCSTRRRAR
jgi:hypothetical protein